MQNRDDNVNLNDESESENSPSESICSQSCTNSIKRSGDSLRGESRELGGYPYANVPGCKHNSFKKCFLCLVRTRTTVPESLYLEAKRVNFECRCKMR